MKRLLVALLMLAIPCFGQDLRPSAYVGNRNSITVRGGKIMGSTGGVVTLPQQDITPAANATTYVYVDLSSVPVVATSTSGFPATNYFPICTVVSDINGVITSFTDNRPDSYMAGGSSISPTTVTGLSAYTVKGNIVAVTDGTSSTDCTVGGGTTTVVCQYTGSAWTAVGGTGTGSVTSFSAGTLSPLFSTSVATATTTPALSFSLSTAAANTVFGNFTGGVAAPTFSAAPAFSAANLTNFPTLNQNTSGSAASLSSTLGCAVFPALTGDTTTSAGSCATTTAKINGTALSGLATGILKNTTGTGVPSIAIAADFPTLNQNTSGTASNLSGTPTLPNGTLATTQAAGSNDTKLATDAYVDGHLIFEGTVTLGTSAIASGAKTAPVTVSATGVATTDVVSCGFNGDPTAVTGYGVSATGAVLTIYPYPTANNINVIVGNNTSGSITPGALTLNCLVVRK